MNKTLKSVLLWVLTLLIAGFAMVYQNLTGPTKPVRDKITLADQEVKISLPRSSEIQPGEDMFDIVIENVPEEITGTYQYKRFKSYDTWTVADMIREGNNLIAPVPQLDTAGKVEYQITLIDGEESILLTEEPVIMRYKGMVNKTFVLIPHIFFMVLAMLFSTRTGLEAIFKGKNIGRFAGMTLIFLTIGGLILGPIMQKYAFGAYWTGWPFGTDLTDNKTIGGWLFWLLAFVLIRKNKKNWVYSIVASFIFLSINMIPHSTLGSEIDYTKLEDAPVVEQVDAQVNQTEEAQEEAELERAVH